MEHDHQSLRGGQGQMRTIKKSDDARTKMYEQDQSIRGCQLQLQHGLLWNLAISWAELKLQDRLQWFAWQRHCCTVARVCLRGCMCVFAVSVVCTKQVSWAPVHAGVYIPQVFLTSPYIATTQSLQGVYMLSCVFSFMGTVALYRVCSTVLR